MTEWLHFHFSLPELEKQIASHSSVLAWRIPEMVEPGGLLSMGLHRIGHSWSDLAEAAAEVPSELREWTSYRWRVNHLWSEDSTNCKAIVNNQAEEFSFHSTRTTAVKSYWTHILCKAIRISHSGYCFLIRKKDLFCLQECPCQSER